MSGIKSILKRASGPWDQLINRPPHNIPALDFLRSCAILLVFTGHMSESFTAPRWFSRLPISHYGWTGVDLFFVLSGVLIGIQLWKELKRTGGIRIGHFLLRRGLRIWPLYAAFVLLLGAEVLLLGHKGSGLWADALYLSNYVHGQVSGSWSLATEEQFYILAPISLALGLRLMPLQRLWILPALGPVLLIGARFLTVLRHPALTIEQQDQLLYFPIHTHADGLAVGLVLAWIVVMRPQWIRSAKVRWSAAAVGLFAGAALYAIKPILTNFAALALVFGALVLLGLGATRLPALINWHGFYIISRLSYGIYLNHLILVANMPKQFRVEGSYAFFIYYSVFLLLSIAMAAVTFALIEWPFLQLRERWLDHGRKVETAAGTAIPTANSATEAVGA